MSVDAIQSVAFAAQIGATALAIGAEMPEKVRGALLLISFFCFGINIGSCCAKKRTGRR